MTPCFRAIGTSGQGMTTGLNPQLLIDQLVDRGFSRSELDLLCVRKVSDRVNRGPAVIAVTGDVEPDDPLMVHGHHEMIEDLPAGNELVELFKRIDEKWQIDESEPGSQVGGSHGAAAHALNSAHLELVEDLHLSAEHGKGFEIDINLAIGPFPEFIPDGESGVDPLENRMRDIGHNAFVLGP